MPRKLLTPVSIGVFILGIAMVVWSLTRGSDSSAAPSDSRVTSTVSLAADSATDASDPFASTPSSDSIPDSSSGAASPSRSPVATTATAGASTSGTSPSVAPPAATVRPLTPAAPVVETTVVTAAPLSIPPVVVTPAVVAPPACLSFADCAQKLFSTWLEGGSGSRTRALNYGTPAAVSALFERRTIGVTWDPTVYRSTSFKYVAVAISRPGESDGSGIEFLFTSGQSGYKVQSVVWF